MELGLVFAALLLNAPLSTWGKTALVHFPIQEGKMNSEGVSLISSHSSCRSLTHTIRVYTTRLNRGFSDPSLLLEIFFHLSRLSTIDISPEKVPRKS